MPYLILAMLLAVVQAVPPVPRKAADSAAGTRQHVNSQSSPNKTPAKPSSSTVNADATKRDETKGDGIRPENAEHPIRVTELPSVSVRPAKRDWADWGYWVFSGLLVIVGGFQVWLLFRTLGAIQGQAVTYRQQFAQMVESGRQTDDLIGTMKDTAIRELRAYVCLHSAVIEFRQERAPEIQIYMKNYGQTPAYDVRWWAYIWIAECPSKRPLPEPPPNIVLTTSLMAPRGKPHPMVSRVTNPIPEDIMPKLGTPEFTLYAYGKVTYRDAFGVNRYTRYRLMYGGYEPVVNRDKNGIKVALLKADYEGNEAD